MTDARRAARAGAWLSPATHGLRIMASAHRPKPSRSLAWSSMEPPGASLARSSAARGRSRIFFFHLRTSLAHRKTPSERRMPSLERRMPPLEWPKTSLMYPRTSLLSPRVCVTYQKTSFYGPGMSFTAVRMSENRSGLPECLIGGHGSRPGDPGVVAGISVRRLGPSRRFFAVCVSTLGGFRHW